MARVHELLILSDNVLEIPLLADGQTGDVVTGATVVATLLRVDTGAEVSGETWPLALTEDLATPGRYTATLESTLALADGDEAICVITAQSGPTQRTFYMDVEARKG